MMTAASRSPRDRPNFVMLFADDLGYGDVGFTGHPTTRTPSIDRLAAGGKVLTTWYSGCPVCSGSRAALMTGRQFPRTGVPGVFASTVQVGLPLNETTVAEKLKQSGYATGMVGKWHLGQRPVYLPGRRGFDHYLGLPYSDDMGLARATSCSNDAMEPSLDSEAFDMDFAMGAYKEMGYTLPGDDANDDPAGRFLPLLHMENGNLTILEQPVDFTYLAQKYSSFAVDFIDKHKEEPFFLYVALSHVHTTAINQPELQYAGCSFKNLTSRGPFGDALAEADWIIGNVHQALVDAGVEENTLILFTSDNGPWLIRQLSGGSPGLFTGRFAGYWNTGKGSTWEGGIREPAFAYWKGQIAPLSRSEEVVSSLDVFPTFAALAGVPLEEGRIFDGRDMSSVLLNSTGKSKHDFLFFYGGCMMKGHGESIAKGPAAVRYGEWKAHWCTGPGPGTPEDPVKHYSKFPLLFHITKDPSEANPLNPQGDMPAGSKAQQAMRDIQAAYEVERRTFVYGRLTAEPDGPGEGPDKYGLCCDRTRQCDCDGPPSGQLLDSRLIV